MNLPNHWFTRILGVLVVTTALAGATAQQFDPKLYQEMRWRMIGPFRGGRTVAIAGVPRTPNLFYMAAVNGGVWKSTDYGRTWDPIFDGQPSGSVGAMAIAPSDPSIIYVGSGEGLLRPDLAVGDGIYKSIDAGKTWTHLGLRDGHQFASILVNPRDPNLIYVAVLGHPYGPNEQRGVFRSTDGGQSWKKILYKDENTGAVDLAFDPSDSKIIYAALWSVRRPPWTMLSVLENPAGSGLYKSTDGGNTWRPLTRGLPTAADGIGRIGIGIAASDPKRIYAMVDSPMLGGVYRSDDAGENWRRINTEDRLWGRGFDFATVRVAPDNEDVVYVANTATYKSTDGGAKFVPWKGAPGGDDYHNIWINPENPQIILLGSDQGATLTVNGGATWSSWYNQPTAEFYHVITDNQFPYWVYGGQQESGSIGTASRSDYGAITFRDWITVGIEEWGYAAPDPLNPNIIYGGKVTRYDRTTGQTQDVSPVVLRTGKYRFNRTAPLLFSPVDPHTLYLGSNVLFRTTDGGQHWEIISPDLTRDNPGVPATVALFMAHDPDKREHRGVIYSIAPSPKDGKVTWCGTDDGLIQMTRNGGKSWQNVTPPELTSWSKLAQLDASHFDVETVYAAVNRFRLDDQRAYIYRTHDGGKTWQKITTGLPDEPVNTVREDPERKGLLFAGTERSVYVSFDDGDHWESLQLNLPATSIRDLVVHGDDVVVGTHGRSFWILDDITPLRQMTDEVARSAVHLLRPQLTYQVRRSLNTDTPLPPEEPTGQNPPDGAILDYYLATPASGPVILEILDGAGKLVRRYSSTDRPEPPKLKELVIPSYWVRMPRVLSADAGMHRWVWDQHYPLPDAIDPEYPISAIPHDTPRGPLGPRALPGVYTVRLTVGSQSYTQPLTIRMDPRVKTSAADLKQQFELETRIAAALHDDHTAFQQVRDTVAQLRDLMSKPQAAPLKNELQALMKMLSELQGSEDLSEVIIFHGAAGNSLRRLNTELVSVLNAVDTADAAPTPQTAAAFEELRAVLDQQLARWKEIQARDVPTINGRLRRAELPELKLTPNEPRH